MKNQNTMTVKDIRNIETVIQGISTYELREEVKEYYLTESQFNSYAQSRIDGDSHSQCMSYLREDVDFDFLDEAGEYYDEENQTAINNFFNGDGVQSIKQALTVFQWIQARYCMVLGDVKLKYDADKESLQNYIIKNS